MVSFGDNVRIIETEETMKAGVSGLIGNVYGETTPSVTNVEVIGNLREDFAFNVFFEKKQVGFWFASDLLEFVDHSPGSEITLNGVDKKWVRNAEGEWVEESLKNKKESFFKKIFRTFLK